MIQTSPAPTSALTERALAAIGDRSLVFVGLMGAGKSAIGRLTASILGLRFVDSDHEIQRASRMTISELFDAYGEPEFRALEGRVIRRLLDEGPQVLSTGGGAFIGLENRAAIKERGLSVWLEADLEVLWERVSRRSNRPLLKTADPIKTLKALMDQRYPIYAEADLRIVSRRVRKDIIAGEVIEAVARYGEAVS